MTPRLRAHALQAHSLHCQGLTYRQIGERMKRSPSTVAGYIKAFNAHRDEIIQSLAADQLAHSLAGLNSEDSDLHQQHIDTARELRLQTDTLDRITDRQQRRNRRIQEEGVHDAIRQLEAVEQLSTTLFTTGLWPEPDLLKHYFETGQFPDYPATTTSDDADPRATNTAESKPSLSPQTAPTKPDQHPNNPKPTTQKSEQTRTNPIEPEQDPARSPAKQAKSDSRSEKPEEQPRQEPERRIGPRYPISYHNPTGYVPRRSEEIPLVRELFGRPLSKRPFPRD